MNEQQPAFHGSDLEKIEQAYHIPKKDIVSFSANVNPLGFSKKAEAALLAHTDVISAYPDPSYRELKSAIAAYCGADPSHILLGSGVTELLRLLIDCISPSLALVAGPTYSEYEKDLTRAKAAVSYLHAKESDNFILTPEAVLNALSKDTGLVILCSPNNPTSFAFSKEEIGVMAAALKERGVYLIIDETYVEFSLHAGEISAASLTASFDNLIVLRGTSKFFATPGLRLGYALTSNDALLLHASKKQDLWNINSVAALLGTVMFTDDDYIRLVQKTTEEEKNYICSSLSSIKGVRTYPVAANFVLVRLPDDGPDSSRLFDSLIRQGLMIRDCSTFPALGNRFVRICFMSHADNVRLIEAIRSVLTKG